MPGMQGVVTSSLADSVSLSHRKEVVKEGQEPPGDIHCHNQREQHRTAACRELVCFACILLQHDQVLKQL